jgi:PKD repeat protein
VARWLQLVLPVRRGPSAGAPAGRVAAALAPLLAIFALSCVAPAAASAAPEGSPYEYGEVLRFGGFDAKAYDGGDYEREPTEGKFLDPTGFAVDPQDNTVYVVDRTSNWAANPTSWRIQQFKSNGELEGVTAFTLPNVSNFATREAYAIDGLAVDHRAGRLYALVVGSPPLLSPHEEYPVAQELLAWSTTPEGKRLVAASGVVGGELASDPLNTGGALVGSSSQLQSKDGTRLYSPQGIAIDRLEVSGVDNPVAIEASNLLSENGLPLRGDTIVQQVATQGQGAIHAGDLLASWSSASLAATLAGSWGPEGIFDDPDGTISVLLEASEGSSTNAYVAKVTPDLSKASVVDDNALSSPREDFDEAALAGNPAPPFDSFAGVTISNVLGAGPDVAQLSTPSGDADGPYTADIFTDEQLDYQFSPEHTGPEYWIEGEPEFHVRPNIGIRILQPAEGGVISTPRGGTIVNTLGNKTVGEPCNIGAVEAVLAAGADGTLWVLDRGPASDSLGDGAVVGREVIELAPRAELPSGKERLCPQPTGTFTMGVAGGPSQSAEGPALEVPAGTQIAFDAGSIEVKSQPIATGKTGKPFAYEWDFEGDAAGTFTAQKVLQMKGPNYYFPSSTIIHTYTKPGTYVVTARMLSDYGAYTTTSGMVVVTPNLSSPHPLFTTAVAGGQEVAFDATGSTPGIGKIVHYAWNWGDGSPVEGEEAGAPIVTHAYAAPGSYEVTLTVTNSAYQSATSAPQTVVVEASKPPPSGALSGPLYAIPLPALYPIPPAPHGKHWLDLAARARFAQGRIEVQVSCPKGAGRCTGTTQAQTAARFATSAKHGGRAAKSRRLTLGQATLHLAAGRHATVVIRISKQGLTLLTRLGRLPVLVSLVAHDGAGDYGAQTLRLTLAEPAKGASARARKRR